MPLTNSSPATVGASIAGPLGGFAFGAVYTAADVGCYKPDMRNFVYLLEHVRTAFGAAKRDVLHVAQSLFHDLEPAAKVGLQSCWVNRHGVMGGVDLRTSLARFGWEVESLAELADLVDESFREQ